MVQAITCILCKKLKIYFFHILSYLTSYSYMHFAPVSPSVSSCVTFLGWVGWAGGGGGMVGDLGLG